MRTARQCHTEPPARVLRVSGSDAAPQADFDALYRDVHPSLFRYLDRMTGDPDAAEDVAQEAFVRLLGRPDLAGDAARLWLFTVATNLVRDRGRAIARRQRLLSGAPLTPTSGPLPDEEVARAARGWA